MKPGSRDAEPASPGRPAQPATQGHPAAVRDEAFDLRQVDGAAGIAQLAQRLYGASFASVAAQAGVLHVTAVDGNTGRTLRIDEHSPKSRADTFALNLARARADAIVITGKILRDEPDLSYAPGAPGPVAAALSDFRATLGLAHTPLLVVLTRGAGLPLDHRVFHDGHTRPVIYGPADGVAALSNPGSAEVVGTRGEPTLDALLTYLRTRGARCISFEAGPSTTRALYHGPSPALDELCLSTYEGPPLSKEQLAGDAPPVPPGFVRVHTDVRVLTDGGPWVFARYRRAG